MALQFKVDIRNDWLDRFEALTGTGAVLKIRSGAPPASCAAADSGTVLATIPCPSDYMAAASGGAKAKTGTWADGNGADASGTPGHFRLYASDGTTCWMQGTCTGPTLGTGDMLLDSDTLTLGVPFSISTFTLTAPGA